MIHHIIFWKQKNYKYPFNNSATLKVSLPTILNVSSGMFTFSNLWWHLASLSIFNPDVLISLYLDVFTHSNVLLLITLGE